MKLSDQIDASALCSYALWEGVSNLENKVEMLTKQNDDLLAYNQTRTDELAASVEQASNFKKQRDELLASLMRIETARSRGFGIDYIQECAVAAIASVKEST